MQIRSEHISRYQRTVRKALIVLFVFLLFTGQFPFELKAEESANLSTLAVMTWDDTTERGSVSLDSGEFSGKSEVQLDVSEMSWHLVSAKAAPGYYFRGWHIGLTEASARKEAIKSTESTYGFYFGRNLAFVQAPYYLIADFAPLGQNDEPVDPAALNGTNWMSGIPNERKLNEINIPGTHDSLCKRVWCAHAFGGMFEEDAITQDLTLEEQLNAGIRLLDLRLTNETTGLTSDDPENLSLCHGS